MILHCKTPNCEAMVVIYKSGQNEWLCPDCGTLNQWFIKPRARVEFFASMKYWQKKRERADRVKARDLSLDLTSEADYPNYAEEVTEREMMHYGSITLRKEMGLEHGELPCINTSVRNNYWCPQFLITNGHCSKYVRHKLKYRGFNGAHARL